MTENMECPCPCEVCGEWFELNEGLASERLTTASGHTIICESCGYKERDEIERETEIADLKEGIENAKYEIKSARERIAELESTVEEKR